MTTHQWIDAQVAAHGGHAGNTIDGFGVAGGIHNSAPTGTVTAYAGAPIAITGTLRTEPMMDSYGRVVCAPGSQDGISGIYQVTEARYDRLIRNQDELLAAVRAPSDHGWIYDMRSSLLGAGAMVLFLVVALALFLRRGAK